MAHLKERIENLDSKAGEINKELVSDKAITDKEFNQLVILTRKGMN